MPSFRITGVNTRRDSQALEAHLSQFLLEPEISVDVQATTARYYYVVLDGGGAGQTVIRLPITGNETVMMPCRSQRSLGCFEPGSDLGFAALAPGGRLPPRCSPSIGGRRRECRHGNQIIRFCRRPGLRSGVSAHELDITLARMIAPVERVFVCHPAWDEHDQQHPVRRTEALTTIISGQSLRSNRMDNDRDPQAAVLPEGVTIRKSRWTMALCTVGSILLLSRSRQRPASRTRRIRSAAAIPAVCQSEPRRIQRRSITMLNRLVQPEVQFRQSLLNLVWRRLEHQPASDREHGGRFRPVFLPQGHPDPVHEPGGYFSSIMVRRVLGDYGYGVRHDGEPQPLQASSRRPHREASIAVSAPHITNL